YGRPGSGTLPLCSAPRTSTCLFGRGDIGASGLEEGDEQGVGERRRDADRRRGGIAGAGDDLAADQPGGGEEQRPRIRPASGDDEAGHLRRDEHEQGGEHEAGTRTQPQTSTGEDGDRPCTGRPTGWARGPGGVCGGRAPLTTRRAAAAVLRVRLGVAS